MQEEVAEVADEGIAFREGEAVSGDGPEDGDQGHEDETMHHGGQHVLAADQATVEERQAGAGHHEDEGGADEHPGVIAGALGGFDGRFRGGEALFESGGREGCLSEGQIGQQG